MEQYTIRLEPGKYLQTIKFTRKKGLKKRSMTFTTTSKLSQSYTYEDKDLAREDLENFSLKKFPIACTIKKSFISLKPAYISDTKPKLRKKRGPKRKTTRI